MPIKKLHKDKPTKSSNNGIVSANNNGTSNTPKPKKHIAQPSNNGNHTPKPKSKKHVATIKEEVPDIDDAAPQAKNATTASKPKSESSKRTKDSMVPADSFKQSKQHHAKQSIDQDSSQANVKQATKKRVKEDSANSTDAPKFKKIKVEKEEQEKADSINYTAPNAAEVEELLVDKTQQTPQSMIDYERVLVGSPNSSYLWIRYMAFLVSLGETEQARAVAERALKRIQPSDQKERYNIWTALMNLEIMFGSKDSIMTVFQRTLAYNDPKKMYMHLGYLLGQNGSHELAEEVFADTLKKFHYSKKALQAYLDYLLLSKQDLTAFRSQLSTRIKTLAKKKHVFILKHCATQEYKHGDVERARTMFEGLVATNPKHADLWMIYIDMELKVNSSDKVAMRRLFERCMTMPFSSKSMKTVFKKYMMYEQQNGDTKAMEHVRQKALDYVNKK